MGLVFLTLGATAQLLSIGLQRSNAQSLGHFGEVDKNPSLDDMRKLDVELTKHGKAHEFYSYAGANHAFMDPHHVGRYNAQADQLSWPRTLDFFRKYLVDAPAKRAVAS